MKRFAAAAILLYACNGEPSSPAQTQSPSTKLLPQVSTGTKSDFKKPDKLPAGIENIFGKMPSKENGFYKFSFPRTDLSVNINGLQIDPRLAFTTWFSFMPTDSMGDGMMMGDVVLLESEFKNVEKKLDEKGIDISAIHNHLLEEKPKVMYLHVMATGKAMELFSSIKEVLLQTATPLHAVFSDTSQTTDWGRTEDTLGRKGKRQGNILTFNIPRNEKIQDGGMEIPEGFGISSAINFQKTGNRAAVTGDLVLIPSEVSTVSKILSRGNIVVTALHSHMLFEQPRLFFMHFWAVDDPEKIAAVFHEVLESTNH